MNVALEVSKYGGGLAPVKGPKRCAGVHPCALSLLALPACMLTTQVTVPTLGEASAEALAPLLGGLPLELRAKMEAFIQGVYAVSR